jgi:hypothetical protein
VRHAVAVDEVGHRRRKFPERPRLRIPRLQASVVESKLKGRRSMRALAILTFVLVPDLASAQTTTIKTTATPDVAATSGRWSENTIRPGDHPAWRRL